MRKEILVIAGIVLMMGVYDESPVKAAITDVTIQPETPTMSDILSISVLGEEGSGPIQITDALVEFQDDLITLDIYLDIGFLTVVTPWSHTEDIGPLLQGTYELTVNSIFPAMPSHNDTYLKSFEVIPEPSTILLLFTGSVMMLKRRSR